MKLTFKTELQLTEIQRRSLLQAAGNARWAYNWGLNKHNEAYAAWQQAGKPKGWKWPNAMSLHKELVMLKKLPVEQGGIPWMYLASKAAPNEALRNLDRAFKNMFAKRAKYPRFKSRKRGVGGFRLTGLIHVADKTIQLPRVGIVRIKPGDHEYVPIGTYSCVTITERAGRWFISIFGTQEIPEAQPNGHKSVGLDMGVVRLATLSDGTVMDNPAALKRYSTKLKTAQKELSRRQLGSANRKKSKLKVARLHAQIHNIRVDALHKASNYLAKNHGQIIIEDLQIRNMTRSGGSRKRGLNRVLQDASLGEFRRQLEYKAKLNGCCIVMVPPQFTSQRCSRCGHVEAGNRVSQSRFECLVCRHTENADLNAAKNILVAGSCPDTLNACGGRVRPGTAKSRAAVGEAGIDKDRNVYV